MALLDDSTRKEVRRVLSEIIHPVHLVLFTQGRTGVPECRTCAEARMLAEEIAALHSGVRLEIRDFTADAASAETLRIDKIPALALLGGGDPPRDFGIRFFGIPGGYEFGVLIEDLLMVGGQEIVLMTKTAERLAGIRKEIHLQVFTTPTCPHCPRTAVLAHRLAFASDRIRADVIEAMEFPHLVNRYGISGVPLTVVDELVRIEGTYPEDAFLERVLKAEVQAHKQAAARSAGGS
jgi:glutaredoxin-like protein